MAKQNRSLLPRFLRHHALLAAEILFLVDLLLRQIERFILEQLEWLPALRVLLVMGLVLGLLSVLILLTEGLAKQQLDKVFKVADKTPFPFSRVIMHATIMGLLFLVYAWDLELLGRLI